MTMTALRATVLVGAAGLGGLAVAQDQVVLYRVDFVSTWSASTHPTDFPFDPHFSGLVGGSHDATAEIWRPGGIATQGVEDVAERGNRTRITNEVQALVDSGQAHQVILGGNIALSPGSTTRFFEVSDRHPLVSLISMIAPSPDWIVGVHDLPMLENGTWVAGVSVELDPYDAGTDSGPTYASPNADVTPHEPIRNLADEHPFLSGGPLGTMTFTFVRTLGCPADLAAPFGELNIDDVLAFVNAFAAGSPVAELTGPAGELDIDDVLAFLDAFAAGCP